jgi:hypothetical protein
MKRRSASASNPIQTRRTVRRRPSALSTTAGVNPWLGLAIDAAWLAAEAQWVIAARVARLAAGGALAQSEAQRMFSEKAAALLESQMTAGVGLARGRKGPATAKRVLAVYRRRVRANRRRLSSLKRKP